MGMGSSRGKASQLRKGTLSTSIAREVGVLLEPFCSTIFAPMANVVGD